MKLPYGLIPITIIVLLLYAISWGITQIGTIKKLTHRRIWNSLLLATFFITGGLGILLAVQVNYKLEMPLLEKILKWHVDVGISMVIIALIHFTWHFGYYKKILKKFPAAGRSQIAHSAAGQYIDYTGSPALIMAALFVTGCSGILSQLIVLREFLNVFQGNELVIGLTFSIWMLLTSTGARLGKQIAEKNNLHRKIILLLLIQGITPVIIVTVLYITEPMVFPPGTLKGILTSSVYCMALLIPLCIPSGMLFTLLASSLSGTLKKNAISMAYGWESAGSLIAGLLFSLCMVYLLSTFQILAFIIACNTMICFLSCSKTHIIRRHARLSVFLPLMVLSVIIFIFPADKKVRSAHFVNQELLYTKDTQYGNVAVTSTYGQFNFFSNNSLLFSTENLLFNEEAVHYAMIQHAHPKKVLIVSGGISGITDEVMRYQSIQSVDYFEMNPWIIRAEEKFSNIAGYESLHVISKDARLWIKQHPDAYDVIIINSPDPVNAQINRYFTIEFFSEVQKALNKNGILSVSLSSTANYMSDESKEVNALVYYSLDTVFKNVTVIQGERNFYIASDSSLRTDIAALISASGIENEYVNQYYIDDDLLQQRSTIIVNSINEVPLKINSDRFPKAYFIQIRYWLNMSDENAWIVIALISVLAFLVIRKMSPVSAGVFTGGFTGAGMEFLILIAFQTIYGYMYQMLGIIIGLYMAGLTAGSLIQLKTSRSKTLNLYILSQSILIVLILLFPLMIMLISSHFSEFPWLGKGLLLIVTFAVAFDTGLLFNMASRLEPRAFNERAALLYAVDLTGAAGGMLLTALVLYPLTGMEITSFVLALIILSGLAVLLANLKKYTR